jgi:hypothetical protein
MNTAKKKAHASADSVCVFSFAIFGANSEAGTDDPAVHSKRCAGYR